MKQITIQSIEASLRENFTNYPESYPTNDCSPSEDAISNLLNWIENEHENDQDEDKGTLEEWIEICTNYFIYYFDFKEEEELGENKAYILDQIHFLQLNRQESILKEIKGLNYYDLIKKYDLIGSCGLEDDRHYFFKYNESICIEYHDKADTTITTLSVDELIEYYT